MLYRNLRLIEELKRCRIELYLELLSILQTINPMLNAKPNTLVRRLNAKTKELLERYCILYSGRRVDNVKYLVLELQSDNSDMCGNLDAVPEIGNIGHIALKE